MINTNGISSILMEKRYQKSKSVVLFTSVGWLWILMRLCRKPITAQPLAVLYSSLALIRVVGSNPGKWHFLLAQCTGYIHCDSPTSWVSWSFWSTNHWGFLPLASNGCIRCECKRTSIHSFAHYLPDTEEAHHLWRVLEPTHKRAQKKLVCFAERKGGKGT